jgi:predicted negative regulator of RcsB-dependent stress response
MAQQSIRGHYLAKAAALVGKEGVTEAEGLEALDLIGKSKAYLEPDAEYHYLTAMAHKIRGNLAMAVSCADQALEMHEGSDEEKAKIHLVRGVALLESGDKEGARAAFTSALHGQSREAAEDYLKALRSEAD